MKKSWKRAAMCLILAAVMACVFPAASCLAEEEGADFFEEVFDTSQDAGKLTVRYLAQPVKKTAANASSHTGDCAVYTSPEGKIMLVDCGQEYDVEETLEQLAAMDIERIDIVVMSHPHGDHIGGFIRIADTYPIGQVYTNGHEYDSDTYRNTMAKIDQLGIPCDVLNAGDEFMFGEQVQVKVYSPDEGVNDEVAGGFLDANDGSIAMRLSYGESSFWTSGDLYVPGEKKLVETYGDELQSDVVKMDHHGLNTSNGKDFVTAMSPKVAVGMYDAVGSQILVMRFAVVGAEVFFNYVDGAVRVSTTGDGAYDVQTQLLRDVPIMNVPPKDGHYVIG